MHFSRFDRLVGGVLVLALAAIGLTVFAGDRVGVQPQRVAPLGEGHTTDNIVIEFADVMQRETVQERLSISPEVDGEARWSGNTFIFEPSQPLQPGETYLVELAAGAQGQSGREVLNTYQFSFEVAAPRVAYLAPADSAPQNVWVASPGEPDSASQVTFSTAGIFDFSASPDGRQLAFSERRTDTPGTDLKVLNLATNTVQILVACPDSDCSAPVWRPDGNVIAYTRVDFNSDLPQVGTSSARVWLVDLTSDPATTQPLFEDSQILGYGVQWSADGQTISLFDNSVPGIVVYDFQSEALEVVGSEHGTSGTLAPDGETLVFPEVVFREGQVRTRLLKALMEPGFVQTLTQEDALIDDDVAVWHPDGERLAIGRRYWDERYTRGLQIYQMDAETGDVEPLVVDERYAHGFFTWDANGERLVMQRFPQLTQSGEVNSGGKPEIWVYDVTQDELMQVATNGFSPKWVP